MDNSLYDFFSMLQSPDPAHYFFLSCLLSSSEEMYLGECTKHMSVLIFQRNSDVSYDDCVFNIFILKQFLFLRKYIGKSKL